MSDQTLIPPHLPWHKSLISNAGIMASLILVIGYGLSLYFSISSIDSTINVAHDQEVAKNFDIHLKQIKNSHNLWQELIQFKISLALKDQNLENFQNSNHLKDFLQKTLLHEDIRAIHQISSLVDIKQQSPAVEWFDRRQIRILNFTVEMPRPQTVKEFDQVAALKQRYHLIGQKLHENIRPTLIYTNALILLFSFLLLATSLTFMSSYLRKKLSLLLRGFSYWSRGEFSFRFSEHLPGEFHIIAQQFNNMAFYIEDTQKKSLYLEKMASWQIIAKKMAHEIKNPLTPIQMMVAELVRRQDDPPDSYKKLLLRAREIVDEEISSLRRMVDHFSKFSELPKAEPTLTNLNAMLERVLTMTQASYPKYTFTLNHLEDTYSVHVDEKLVKQVVFNLLKNAVEASLPTSAIEISVSKRNQFILIQIIDFGPGIPEALQEKVFEAYFTTKHTGPQPGMGLGLAICRKIILEHHGDLTFYSRAGHTEFTISLPLVYKNQQEKINERK